MKIGFIGAGKVGFSFGKYLTEHKIDVSGFYSKTFASAQEAAEFTATHPYDSLTTFVRDSDVIMITVPDRSIASVWERLKEFPLQDKIICHMSGACSSAIFSGIEHTRAYGFSIHPLFAFHDRYESYKELSKVFFTVEGKKEYFEFLMPLISKLPNHYAFIGEEAKTRYHAASAIVSNLVVGLCYLGESILKECGFDQQQAHEALSPLIQNNACNIASVGPRKALTGPIERNDVITVKNHIESFDERISHLYKVVSYEVLKAAKEKHPELDYEEMENLLR